MPKISPQTLLNTTYILLNSIRLLTISSLIMGLIAQFIIMVISLKTRLDDLNSLGGINVTGNGALYAGTDLSTLSGAVAGFAVARSLSVIIIFLGLLSELPTPTSLDKKVQSFWNRAFPSFGHEHGKGILGLLILLIGSFELAQNIQGFPRVASWFLFICGIFNLLLGITIGSDVHTYRSASHLSSLSTPSTSQSSSNDLESQIPPPTISFSSTPQQPMPRSPLPSVLNFSRFIPPSFRRNSVQSDSIYSQDNSSQYPHSHTRHEFQSFSNHRHEFNTRQQGGGGSDGVTGYMSERGDTSPVSMQQAFSARNFEITGPMEQVGRSRKLGDY